MKYSVQVEYIQTWNYDNIEASTEDEAEQIALKLTEDELLNSKRAVPMQDIKENTVK